MTDEQQKSGPDSSIDVSGATAFDVSDFLNSVEHRADAGVEERQQQIKVLQREQRNLRAVAALASALTTELAASHFGAALFTIERSKDARTYLQDQQPSVDERIEALRTSLLPRVDEIIGELPRSLPAALEARGITLDASSRSPKFTVERSFVVATIDRKGRQAIVQTRGGKKERVAVDADVLADHIAASWQRCFERTTDLAAVARRVRDAWTTLAKPGKPRVSVPALLAELGAHDKQFALDEFAVDLSRLVSSGPGSVPEAASLRLDHTKNDAEGLLLPGLEQRGYFGYVSFYEGGAS